MEIIHSHSRTHMHTQQQGVSDENTINNREIGSVWVPSGLFAVLTLSSGGGGGGGDVVDRELYESTACLPAAVRAGGTGGADPAAAIIDQTQLIAFCGAPPGSSAPSLASSSDAQSPQQQQQQSPPPPPPLPRMPPLPRLGSALVSFACQDPCEHGVCVGVNRCSCHKGACVRQRSCGVCAVCVLRVPPPSILSISSLSRRGEEADGEQNEHTRAHTCKTMQRERERERKSNPNQNKNKKEHTHTHTQNEQHGPQVLWANSASSRCPTPPRPFSASTPAQQQQQQAGREI